MNDGAHRIRREILSPGFREQPFVHPCPSAANFIFFSCDEDTDGI